MEEVLDVYQRDTGKTSAEQCMDETSLYKVRTKSRRHGVHEKGADIYDCEYERPA